MCECTSMIPGVTYRPCPSITTASGGASTDAPTAMIFPSRSRIDASCITGPAAVRIVAPRITVVRDANGVYVLGNGFAFGTDSMPGSGVVSAVGVAGLPATAAAPGFGAGVVTGAACPAVHPSATTRTAATARRIVAARAGPSYRTPGVCRAWERVLRTRDIVWCESGEGVMGRE